MLNSGTVWVWSEWQRSKLEWYRTAWELEVEVALNQGLALSLLLFAMVMDRLTDKIRQNSSWCTLSRTSRGKGLPWRGDVWRLAKVRQDMTSEWKGPRWNGEVTGIRGKKSGGFEVLSFNRPKQRRKRGEERRRKVSVFLMDEEWTSVFQVVIVYRQEHWEDRIESWRWQRWRCGNSLGETKMDGIKNNGTR